MKQYNAVSENSHVTLAFELRQSVHLTPGGSRRNLRGVVISLKRRIPPKGSSQGRDDSHPACLNRIRSLRLHTRQEITCFDKADK